MNNQYSYKLLVNASINAAPVVPLGYKNKNSPMFLYINYGTFAFCNINCIGPTASLL